MMWNLSGLLLLLSMQALAYVKGGRGMDGEVRLAAGPDTCSGRVEFFYLSQWGTVCDHLWDLRDAQVVCRQLGCGPALSAPGNASFGQGSGPIWMYNVRCSGKEATLAECPHPPFGYHSCLHDDDAGVVCGNLAPTTSTTSGPVTWVPSPTTSGPAKPPPSPTTSGPATSPPSPTTSGPAKSPPSPTTSGPAKSSPPPKKLPRI